MPVMSPNSARSVGWRWTTKRFGTSVRSEVVRRSPSIARSIRRWSWTGWRRARNRRADGRSNSRSKNRSMAVSGGMVGGGVYQRVPRRPGRSDSATLTFGVRRSVHPVEGRLERLRYTLDPLGRSRRPERRPRGTRGPDDRDPDRILLRTLRHALHLRVRACPRPRLQGRPGPVARAQELRPVRRHLDGRGDGRGPERDRARSRRRTSSTPSTRRSTSACQCRQYTCPNCWNEAEARCLTCAPHLGHEILPAPFPDLPAAGAARRRIAVQRQRIERQPRSDRGRRRSRARRGRGRRIGRHRPTRPPTRSTPPRDSPP